MRYRDFYGQLSVRVITPISWVTENKFLAFCYLRNAERHFRVENIVELSPSVENGSDQLTAISNQTELIIGQEEEQTLTGLALPNDLSSEYEIGFLQERLSLLEGELTERELELSTLKGKLTAFNHLYSLRVGKYLAELDEIEAQITEIESAMRPEDSDLLARAQKAREKSRESAKETDEAARIPKSKTGFNPPENIKDLFREIAKKIHPDLSNNEEEKSIRNSLMAEANQAYELGDQAALEALLIECGQSPRNRDGVSSIRLTNLKRKIRQVERRLIEIQREIVSLKSSPLYSLYNEFLDKEKVGVDILAHIADEVSQKIVSQRIVLENLLGRFAQFTQNQKKTDKE